MLTYCTDSNIKNTTCADIKETYTFLKFEKANVHKECVSSYSIDV